MPVLGQETILRGKGIHTGLPSSIRIRRREDENGFQKGLRFFWPGWSKPITADDLSLLHREARRSTILKGSAGQTFRTPEHLLAAALFFANESVDILCDASEVPGLDGSPMPFYEAMAEVASSSDWREYDSMLRWDYEGREGSLHASPSNSFSVEYEWRGQRFTLSDPETAVREILPARTFITYREWLAVKDAGDLLAGADAGSGLLLAESVAEFETARLAHPEFQGLEFPLLHPEGFRMKDEPAKHKIVDLLGDLALIGLALPRLRLEIRNGGHALNHLLVEQLIHEQRERNHS